MIDFEVKGDLAKIQSSSLDANFAELNEWLEGELAAYRTLVVVPENISEAKADRAKIRKLAARIDEQRKMVKKAYMKPYNEFEAKCKKPIELCNSVANHIDVQIKEYEDSQKEELKKKLKKYFDEKCESSDIGPYMKWDVVFNPKWLNATYGIDKAKVSIDTTFEKAASDIEYICAQDNKYLSVLLDNYSRCLDLGTTLRVLHSYQTIDKMKAQRQATKQKEPEEISAAPKEMKIGFVVTASAEQIMALKRFLVSNNIKYEPIGGQK